LPCTTSSRPVQELISWRREPTEPSSACGSDKGEDTPNSAILLSNECGVACQNLYRASQPSLCRRSWSTFPSNHPGLADNRRGYISSRCRSNPVIPRNGHLSLTRENTVPSSTLSSLAASHRSSRLSPQVLVHPSHIWLHQRKATGMLGSHFDAKIRVHPVEPPHR